MHSIEETRPRPGLSIPVVTLVDEDGSLVETDQRALIRHVVQNGYGTDVVFSAGTTGEWDRVSNAVRQRVIQVCAEEVAKSNSLLDPSLGQTVESWAGITAPTREETLENLDFSLSAGVDAAVLAPLSIRDVSDPVSFVARDVADLLDARSRRIPIYLYDNADIAVDPKVPHIRTRQVKAMSRLDFVRGIKVSAPKKVLGNYTKAAANFRERGEFGIYVGKAMLIFELFRPRTGWWGVIAEHWNRYWLEGTLPHGVVAGPANVLPREWQRAWQVCRTGDAERMDAVKNVLDAFDASCQTAQGKRTIACIKRALKLLGVVESDLVAPGTAGLTDEQTRLFDEAFSTVRELAESRIGDPWVTRPPERHTP